MNLSNVVVSETLSNCSNFLPPNCCTMVNTLTELPDEILTEITSYFFEPKTVFSLLLTCKDLYEFFYDSAGKITDYYGCACENVIYSIRKNTQIYPQIPKCKHFVRSLSYYVSYDIDDQIIIDDTSVQYFKELKFLLIRNCERLTDKCLKYLGNLVYLNISSCNNITGCGLKHLTKLEGLDMSYNDGVCDDNMIYISGIKTLCLNDCREITVGSNFLLLKNLFHLEISHNPNVYDNSLKYIENVNTISLSGCLNITCDGLKHLKGCRVLDVKGTDPEFTDKALQHLSNVICLDIRDNSKITDLGLKYLKNIRVLLISRCFQITNHGIKFLKNLEILDMSFNKKIDLIGLDALKKLKELDCYNSFDTDVEEFDILVYLKKRNTKQTCFDPFSSLTIMTNVLKNYYAHYKSFRSI